MQPELSKMFGPLWDRYWITQGLEVYHRNDINSEGFPIEGACVMIVDKVDRQTVKGNENAFRIRGIVCHWYIRGEYRKGVFFTKEILPAEVVHKGMILDWLQR